MSHKYKYRHEPPVTKIQNYCHLFNPFSRLGIRFCITWLVSGASGISKPEFMQYHI